jgi:hypothetical protein
LEARGGIEPPIMVLQTIALPLGDRATGRNEPGQVKPGESEASPAQFPALDYNCKLLPLLARLTGLPGKKFRDAENAKDPPLQEPSSSQRAAVACSGWAARISLTIGAPIRLPHSVQEPS